jgi:hypothetical protein
VGAGATREQVGEPCRVLYWHGGSRDTLIDRAANDARSRRQRLDLDDRDMPTVSDIERADVVERCGAHTFLKARADVAMRLTVRESNAV